jgi:hypothetical protein
MFDHKQANCLCLNGKYSWKAPTRTFLKRKGNRLYRRASKQQLSSIIDEHLSQNEESNGEHFLPFDTAADEQVRIFNHVIGFDHYEIELDNYSFDHDSYNQDLYNDEYLDELCAIHDYMEG